MRIVIVTGIFPPDMGGPATYVPLIASALALKSHSVAVVTLSEHGVHDDSAYPFEVVRIRRRQPRGRRVLATIATVWRLGRRADLAYLNGLVLEGIIACKLLARRPVVIKAVTDLIWERAHSHGSTSASIDDFGRRRHPLKWEVLKCLQAWYVRAGNLVIVPSRFLARIVSGWGIPVDRIAIVPNAVPLPPPSAVEPSFDLVTVARLVEGKGLASLIRLAAGNGWSLKIVGDGPLRRSLQAVAEGSGAGERIVFTGRVPADEVVRHLRSARLFVLNSSHEGLPHAVLEAKAAGVAVAAAAVGGTPEVINDGVDGVLYDVHDEPGMVRVVRRLLGDEAERHRLAAAGSEHVGRDFSIPEMVEATERALITIAGACAAGVS